MNDRTATAILTEQWPPGTATARGTKERLSLLWIFYMFNAAHIDITTLYYSVFINHKPAVHYTQAFLLGADVLIEISIGMILLSRVLKYRAIAARTSSQPMIATTAVITRCAWKWPNTEVPA